MHGTRCGIPDKASVPNFIGPGLPHCDQGDHDYYCMTMLTLFKPWQVGCELKKKDQTWDKAFLEYEFTEHQSELMKNFNLWYECLDSRDDFHAQLRKGEGFVSLWQDPAVVVGELDCQRAASQELDPSMCNADIVIAPVIGPCERHHQETLSAMEKVLRQLCWDKVKKIVLLDTNLPPPTIIQSGSAWKLVVL